MKMGRKILVAIAGGMALSVIVYNFVAAESEHKYVGVKKCAMCHKSEAKGNLYGKWLSTAHA
jgi:hypothetical protein